MAKRRWTRRIAGGLGTLAALVLAASLLAACGDDSDLVTEYGALACDDSLPDAPLVIVGSPVGDQDAASGFQVSGCSRTFESNVHWRLIGRTGEVLASGHASAGGVDGPAPFAFTVKYKDAEPQIAHLEVFADDVFEGQDYPPPRAVVPLVISEE